MLNALIIILTVLRARSNEEAEFLLAASRFPRQKLGNHVWIDINLTRQF
ncbi:MAG: hypothetical protein ACRC62_33645 [Microcoleus sp.]